MSSSKKITTTESQEGKENQQNAKFAILVCDMLNDFLNGTLKCERARRIVPKIKTLLEEARKKKIPIFFCIDEHLPTDHYELKLWGPHAMKGSHGAKIIDELTPVASDYVIPKRRYSAFDGTELDKALKEAYDEKGADTIIITGVTTNICDTHTAYDAFIRGFDIIIPEDAVEAFTEEDHISGLKYLKQIYGAKIERIQDIINTFCQ
jgi:nicotinamidase-related amidase